MRTLRGLLVGLCMIALTSCGGGRRVGEVVVTAADFGETVTAVVGNTVRLVLVGRGFTYDWDLSWQPVELLSVPTIVSGDPDYHDLWAPVRQDYIFAALESGLVEMTLRHAIWEPDNTGPGGHFVRWDTYHLTLDLRAPS